MIEREVSEVHLSFIPRAKIIHAFTHISPRCAPGARAIPGGGGQQAVRPRLQAGGSAGGVHREKKEMMFLLVGSCPSLTVPFTRP
jgi:hypothetical protein